MDVVLRFFNPDQVHPRLPIKGSHKCQYAQCSAGEANLVNGELESGFMLGKIEPTLFGFPDVDG